MEHSFFFPSKSEIRQTCIIFFGVTTKSFILVCGYFLLHTKLKDNLEKVFGELEKLWEIFLYQHIEMYFCETMVVLNCTQPITMYSSLFPNHNHSFSMIITEKWEGLVYEITCVSYPIGRK